jgi:glycosyltransferase involved in cell wall biosynthesis
MKAGLFSTIDPQSPRSWSGLPPFMLRSLQSEMGKVQALVPMTAETARFFYLLARLDRLRPGFFYPSNLNPLAVRMSRANLRRQLAKHDPDLVFAVTASTLVAAVPRSIKVVYIADCTFRQLTNYYASISDLPAAAIRKAEQYEQETIARADALIYASDWAADSAIRDFGADPAKVTVVPLGANLHSPPAAAFVAPPSKDQVSLFLLGVEWQRKGADIAIAAGEELRQRGINASLTIVGCTPPNGGTLPDWVTNIPHLSKGRPDQHETLKRLFAEANFFIMPTRAECFGVVFCEAAAYGLPVIATDTGGVSSAVIDGQTGALLPPEADGSAYADRIAEILADPVHYQRLSQNARRRFEQSLSWEAWAREVANVARSLR